jgi:hypothetical protein
VTVRMFPGDSSDDFSGVRFVIAKGAEPHSGGAGAYLALLQQTAGKARAGEEQAS